MFAQVNRVLLTGDIPELAERENGETAGNSSAIRGHFRFESERGARVHDKRGMGRGIRAVPPNPKPCSVPKPFSVTRVSVTRVQSSTAGKTRARRWGVGDRNNCPNLALSAGSLGNFNHESVSAARMVITEGRGPEPSRGMYAREFTADRQRL